MAKYLTSILILLSVNIANSQDSLNISNSFNYKELTKIFSTQGSIGGLNRYKQFGNEKNNNYYKLDGVVSAHYFLADKYDYKWSPLCYDTIPMSKLNKWILELNMDVHLRMIDEHSSPVRTSYRPGVKLHYTPNDPKQTRKGIHAFYVSFFHYSNGQNGETFATNAYKDYPLPLLEIDSISNAINKGHIFNRFNGSFSTNYFTLAHTYYRLINNFLIFKSKLEYQRILNDGAFEEDLLSYLSRENVSYDVSFLWGGLHHGKPMEKYRLDVFAKYALGDNSLLNPELNSIFTDLNISSTFYWRLPATSQAALFVRAGYSGSDPHNIYLEDRNIFFVLGLASGYFIYQEERPKKKKDDLFQD